MPTRLFFPKRRGWDSRGHWCARASPRLDRRRAAANALPRVSRVRSRLYRRTRATDVPRARSRRRAREKKRPSDPSGSRGLFAFHVPTAPRAHLSRASCFRRRSSPRASCSGSSASARATPTSASTSTSSSSRRRSGRPSGRAARADPWTASTRTPPTSASSATRARAVDSASRDPSAASSYPRARASARRCARARVPAEPPSRDISPTRALLS